MASRGVWAISFQFLHPSKFPVSGQNQSGSWFVDENIVKSICRNVVHDTLTEYLEVSSDYADELIRKRSESFESEVGVAIKFAYTEDERSICASITYIAVEDGYPTEYGHYSITAEPIEVITREDWEYLPPKMIYLIFEPAPLETIIIFGPVTVPNRRFRFLEKFVDDINLKLSNIPGNRSKCVEIYEESTEQFTDIHHHDYQRWSWSETCDFLKRVDIAEYPDIFRYLNEYQDIDLHLANLVVE